MATEMTLVRAAGIIIYTVEPSSNMTKYLLLKASNKPYHWTPPKGRLDPGEEYMDAAYRETLEECGITKDHITLVESFKEVLRYTAHGKDKECVYYLGKLSDPNSTITLSHEHTDYAWVPAANVPEYCDKESLCKMMASAEAHIKKQLQ